MTSTTPPFPRRLLSVVTFVALSSAAAPSFAAGGVSPAAATPVQREQAQRLFLRGKELFGQRKFEPALAEFNASLDVVTSPNTRLYVGRCLRELNRIVPAYVDFERTEVEAREDPRYAKTAEAAHDERTALEPKLGFLQIDVEHAAPATTLKVAGDEVPRGGWNEAVPVLPGSADVVVETPGHAPVTRTMTLSAGEKKQLTLDASADTPAVPVVDASQPARAAEPPSSNGPSKQTLRTAAYIAGGVGVLGLLTFAYFGLQANATYSDLQKACPNGPCPPGHENQIDSGKRQQTVANVGLVVGVLGAGAGVTLFVLSRDKAQPAPGGTSAGVAVGPSWIGVKGAFP
jgi:hypothetical protein